MKIEEHNKENLQKYFTKSVPLFNRRNKLIKLGEAITRTTHLKSLYDQSSLKKAMNLIYFENGNPRVKTNRPDEFAKQFAEVLDILLSLNKADTLLTELEKRGIRVEVDQTKVLSDKEIEDLDKEIEKSHKRLTLLNARYPELAANSEHLFSEEPDVQLLLEDYSKYSQFYKSDFEQTSNAAKEDAFIEAFGDESDLNKSSIVRSAEKLTSISGIGSQVKKETKFIQEVEVMEEFEEIFKEIRNNENFY